MRARSMEVFKIVNSEQEEVRTRVGTMIVNEIARSEEEARKTLMLELKKKKQVAKQKRAKSNWMKNSLVQGLVHELVGEVVEAAEQSEETELMDIILQEEVLEAMQKLWLLDDMELDDSPLEMMDIDHADMKMDLGENELEGRKGGTPIDKSILVECSTLGSVFGKYFEHQLVLLNLVGASYRGVTRKRSWSSRAGYWLSWSGIPSPSRRCWRSTRRRCLAQNENEISSRCGRIDKDNDILQVHGAAGAGAGHVQEGPQQILQQGDDGLGAVHRGQVHGNPGVVEKKNALTTLMGNSRIANWSCLVKRRSMKDTPVRGSGTGSN